MSAHATGAAARAEIDPNAEGVDSYALLTSLVVPRPIAWVSTTDAEGVGNLAPHSFFNVVSGNPPMVMFATVGHKDTLRNVAATGEFVISLAPEDLLEQINASSATFAADVDEAEALDIEMEDSQVVAPRRVASSPAALECRVERVIELPTSSVVIGEVVHIAVSTAVLVEGRPDIDLIRPLSRLGGIQWGYSPRTLEIERPTAPPAGD